MAEKPARKPSPQLIQLLQSRIIYEDKGLIIINKPSGIATHGGSGISFGVIETLRELYPNLSLVHRLDRETSGCLILAKKRSILKELHQLLRQQQIRKTYLAILKGHLTKKRIVDAPLLKNILKSGERIVKVSSKGRPAKTEFRIKQKFPNATLVEAILHTGRTHQTRVHAAHINHPIAGDDKYGDKAFNKTMRQQGLKRLFLHAYSLKCRIPSANQLINVKADLDEDLLNLIKYYENL